MPEKKVPKAKSIKPKRSTKLNKPQETQIVIHLTVDMSVCIMNKDN